MRSSVLLAAVQASVYVLVAYEYFGLITNSVTVWELV